jgi:hypothetical protein
MLRKSSLRLLLRHLSDSFLFSASDILTLPLTSGHHSLEGDFSLETESCPVEEEIPTTEHEEAAPLVGEFSTTCSISTNVT